MQVNKLIVENEVIFHDFHLVVSNEKQTLNQGLKFILIELTDEEYPPFLKMRTYPKWRSVLLHSDIDDYNSIILFFLFYHCNLSFLIGKLLQETGSYSNPNMSFNSAHILVSFGLNWIGNFNFCAIS